MNLKNNTYQQMLAFSQFCSNQDFDDGIQKWLKREPVLFTKSELVCFQRLVQSSRQVPGVCFKKICHLLDEIQEEQGVKLSRDTFKRMLRKAKNSGMVTIYTTVRENGSQTSNLYVFNVFTDTNQEEDPQR